MLRYPLFLIFTVLVVLVYRSANDHSSIFCFVLIDGYPHVLADSMFGLFQFLHAFLLVTSCLCICLIGYYAVFFRKKSTLEKLRVMSKLPFLYKGMQLMHTYLFSLQLSGLLGWVIRCTKVCKLLNSKATCLFFKK
ncbi:competence protein ComGB [Bacillus safensis FO-36b] [Bacillus safensis subsp. safensis]